MAKKRRVKHRSDRGLYRRGRRWWYRFTVPGEGRKYVPIVPDGEKLATTNIVIARNLAARIRQRHARRDAQADAEDLPALLDTWATVTAPGRSARHVRAKLRNVRAFLDAARIKDPAAITAAAVQDWLAKLATEGLDPKTLKNRRASVSAFCRWLVGRGVLDDNPCRHVEAPKIPKAPPRFLNDEEHREALRLAVVHGVFPEVATALMTGMRREELRRMAWGDVDFERRVVIVPVSKSNRPRQIPMSAKLARVLRWQKRRTVDSAHVFPGDGRAGSSGMRGGRWWDEALKPLQAALPVFTAGAGEKSVGRAWHLLRHTFASRLVQRGVSLYKVSRWLGHASSTTTELYAHLQPGHDEDIEHVG